MTNLRIFEPQAGYLYRNSVIVSLWRGVAVLSGIAIDAAVVAKFGLGPETDAFFIAIAIPLILASTIELEVSKVVVPIVANISKNYDVWRYLSNLITLMLILLCIIALCGIYLAPTLITIQAPGLDSATLELAVKLNKILFLLPVFVGIASIMRAALYSFHCFSMPAYTKPIGNSICLFCILLFYETLGIDSYGIGIITGKSVEIIFLCFGMKKEGMRFIFIVSPTDRTIIETGRLMIYTFVMNFVGESRNLLENYLASFLPIGGLSAFRYASRIIHSIAGTLVGGISVSMLPLAGHLMSQKSIVEMAKHLIIGLRLLVIISIPIILCLMIFGKFFISIFFERGKFSSEDTEIVASLLFWMSPYIFFSRLPTILHMPFYGAKYLNIPFLCTIFGVIVNLIWLGLVFPTLKVYAIATGMIVGSIGSSIFSVWLLKRIIIIQWIKLKSFSFQIIILSLVILVSLECLKWLVHILRLKDSYETALVLFGCVFPIITLCFFISLRLKMEESIKAKYFIEKCFRAFTAFIMR